MRKLLLLPLMLFSSALSASQCYYYWAADCFDVRDAATRDITHHVFLSDEVHFIQLDTEQCSADGFAAEHPERVAEATDRMNRALRRVRSCAIQEQLLPKVFNSQAEALRQWQVMSADQPFKRLRRVKKLP